MNKITILILFVIPLNVYSYELGLTGSSDSISADLWLQFDSESKAGCYCRFIWDFDEYENGSKVCVCSDGSISGSSGSGTCSSHGGVSSTKLAEFNRYAVVIGPTYKISESFRFHSGLIMGFYKSDVNIGDESKLDFTKYGLDVGVSYDMFGTAKPRFVISHETEQKQTFVGISYTF